MIGIDRDAEAIALASARLASHGERFRAVRTTYDRIADVAGQGVEAVLMDLGVSSLQLDETNRGFSYGQDAPLDMRMDPSTGESAADLLARAPESELRTILHRFGEERFAARIAREIVRVRADHRVERSENWWTSSAVRYPQLPAATAGTPPSAPSRRSGSP